MNKWQDKRNVVDALKAAIAHRYHRKPVHLGTVLVREVLGKSATIWEDNVEVFEWGSRMEHQICYGWLHLELASAKAIIIVQDEIIDSPRQAVRAVMVSNRKLFGGPSFKVREGLLSLKPSSRRPLIEFHDIFRLLRETVENGKSMFQKMQKPFTNLIIFIRAKLKNREPSAELPQNMSKDLAAPELISDKRATL